MNAAIVIMRTYYKGGTIQKKTKRATNKRMKRLGGGNMKKKDYKKALALPAETDEERGAHLRLVWMVVCVRYANLLRALLHGMRHVLAHKGHVMAGGRVLIVTERSHFRGVHSRR